MQIIDSFNVNVQKPIDNRFVVGPQFFYTNRDNIDYKYNGLRIWDLNDNIPYVWNNATWSSEATSGIAGSGTINFLTKFNTTSSIGNSQLYDNGTNIGIGTTTPLYKLDINGSSRATAFYGNGAFLTTMNASNISSGILSLNRLQNGSNGQIMTSGVSSPQWTSPGSLTGLTASSVVIVNDISDSNDNFLTFVSNTTGSGQLKISSTKLRYQPSNGQLLIGSSNPALNPGFSFIGDTDTGFFRPSSNVIAISTGGFERVRIGTGLSIGTASIVTNGLKVAGDSYANRYYLNNDTTSGIYSSGTGNITIANSVSNIVSFNNGSVGIGITSPTSKLHVIGSASITGGLAIRMTIPFNVNSSAGITYNHNLGYIPIVTIVCIDGNVNPNITLLSTTQVRVYNFNSGGNAVFGTLYLW